MCARTDRAIFSPLSTLYLSPWSESQIRISTRWRGASPSLLQTARGRPGRAEFERAGEREQHARAAAKIIRRAIGERHRAADVGLQTVPQEKANTAAGRGQRQSIVDAKAVVPRRTAVDEAVELIAAQILPVQPLIEPQLDRAGNAVVAADLGTAIAAAKGGAAEIELLRGETAARRPHWPAEANFNDQASDSV